MNKEQFIATLQACYFGDKGAYNKILSLYDENEKLNHYKLLYQKVKERNDKAIEYIWSKKYEYGDLEEDNEDFDIDVYELLEILKGNNEVSNEDNR